MNNNNLNSFEHFHGYGAYVLIWISLLALTGISVVVAGINLSGLTIATAVIIASIKSYLVLTVFMHLRTETTVFKVFLAVALVFLLISFILLFSDYFFIVRN